MPYQNLEATISAADLQSVRDSFANILDKLPFLISLTAKERKSILKTGPDRLSFVRDTLIAVQENPEILPSSFNKVAFQKDVDLFNVMHELDILVTSIAEQINDTRLAAGSEAMQQATQVYTYVKAAAKTTPGLKALADQLGEAFQKSSKKTPPDGS